MHLSPTSKLGYLSFNQIIIFNTEKRLSRIPFLIKNTSFVVLSEGNLYFTNCKILQNFKYQTVFKTKISLSLCSFERNTWICFY